ncbi:MAG: hypothetical protein M3R67_11815 [Acidobacteriota bacterium]|nr:hypothetical protein [Acidobacteriota bacterium]
MRNNFKLACLALVLFILSTCNPASNTNNNSSPAPTPAPSATAKATATPTPACTVKQNLTLVWCTKSGCKKNCYLYEDGKKIRKSGGPEQGITRRELGKYECKCE